MRLVLEGGCFLAGLAAGSLLDLLVQRVPRKEPLRPPWFVCPECSGSPSALAPFPVLWFVASLGRCRRCRHRLPARRLGIESATGVLFLLSAVRFGPNLVLLAYCAFAAMLVAVTAVDIDMRIVPLRFVYPVLAVTIVVFPVASLLDGSAAPLVRSAIGGAGAFTFFFAVHFIYPDGLGFGDVRLSLLLGLYLGWLGEAYVFVGLAISFMLAAAVGLWLVLFKGRGRRSSIPLAPFLAAGSLIAVFWGAPMVRLWLGASG